MRNLILFFLVVLVTPFVTSEVSAAEAVCTDGVAVESTAGSATEYPCLRINLLSHMTISQLGGSSENNAVSDIWGWVDDQGDTDPSNDRSYAIVGLYCSTAFVEVTNPESPVLIGVLPDSTELDGSRECSEAVSTPKTNAARKHDEEKKAGAVWRDIKVINDYAYIVSDHANAGLQIFDLTKLSAVSSPPVNFGSADAVTVGSFNAHNIFTYQGANGSDYAVFVGSGSGNTGAMGGSICANSVGGPVFVNVTSPENPVWAGKFCDDGYTHDIECVVYSGPDSQYSGREICAASNEDRLSILDVTDKGDIQLLSSGQYDFVEYVHQGSFDQQHRYFYQNDELDEQNHGIPTRTMVWDLQDLDSPELATEYLAPTSSIDHNNYVHGNFLYQSNYTSGLRVLDVTSRRAPYQKAFFDTYATNNDVTFDGAWSNYFFSQDLVAVSDISGGLFLLRPTFYGATDTADMTINVTPSENSLFYETPFEYTIDVQNDGPDPSGDVYVTLRLSSGGTMDSTSESDSACEVVTQKLMECRIQNIQAGDGVSYTVRAAGFSDEAIASVAMVSANAKDSAGGNNVADATVTLKARPVDSGSGSVGVLMAVFLLGFVALRSQLKRLG